MWCTCKVNAVFFYTALKYINSNSKKYKENSCDIDLVQIVISLRCKFIFQRDYNTQALLISRP